jgi:Winged helix DNA-binding domain
LTAVRAALAAVGAVAVNLGGSTGYVLADDLDDTEPVEPWAALLPPLDPTTMGWIDREWYLGSYQADLVDSTGNAGATAWWNGRIVGGWRQRETGDVELQLLEDVGKGGRRALEREAVRLTEWFGGRRVLPRYPSPLSKTIAEGRRRTGS